MSYGEELGIEIEIPDISFALQKRYRSSNLIKEIENASKVSLRSKIILMLGNC